MSQETFAVGDVVEWDHEFCNKHSEFYETRLKVDCGAGPFKVIDTKPVSARSLSDVGHHQYVEVEASTGKVPDVFSGAWFKKA